MAAKCDDCTAGKFHGACSHIMTGITGLVLIQTGQITAGDVGDGTKSWQPTKNSSVPVQSIKDISILIGTGALSQFTGFRPEAPPLERKMAEYIKNIREVVALTNTGRRAILSGGRDLVAKARK